jgi:pimeloyl-ACP methyl ester carboxylesterase
MTKQSTHAKGGRDRRRPGVVRGIMTGSLLLATALVATTCARPVDGHPLTAKPIAWAPCKASGSDAQCGRLVVPVDYAAPGGDKAELAVVRFPATRAKIGSLVVNPGGPGGSGVQAVEGMVKTLPPKLREHFDLVGFDPRGVGKSTPSMRCNSDDENDKERAEPAIDYTPAGVERIEKEEKEYVQRCIDTLGKQFLANIGTANTVKDLDMLRAALGDDKLTFLGYSYGTFIGAKYAEAYPQHVRAIVLDGAVDPNADPSDERIRQQAGFQRAFNDYATDCAKSADCPLGTDPTKAVEVYHSLVDPLGPKSLPTSDKRGLSHSDAVTGTFEALYSPRLWRVLTRGLAELKAGSGDILLALADHYMGRNAEGRYDGFLSEEVLTAVRCVDQPAMTDHAKAVEEYRRIRELAPFASYGPVTGNAPLGTCAFWPVPPTSQPHRMSVNGLPPTLVVSTTHDPATPYQAGVDLAKQLGSTLVTFEATRHTVALEATSTCVDDIVVRYLIDPTLRVPDARCVADTPA